MCVCVCVSVSVSVCVLLDSTLIHHCSTFVAHLVWYNSHCCSVVFRSIPPSRLKEIIEILESDIMIRYVCIITISIILQL